MSDGGDAFAVQLRRCRQSAGLSQEELAAQSGLSARAVGNLERGRTRWPHPDSVRRLAAALGLTGPALLALLETAERRLAGAAAAGGGPVPAAESGQSGTGQVVPQQLPTAVAHFVGRERELTALTALLNQVRRPVGAVVISAIGGMAGIGKTALAVHWAHQVAGEFLDGQLYANLRGYDADQPVSAADALASFLRSLGMAREQIPAETEERAAAYRSLLAGRRMLIVLDNAREADQVRPLLPGGASCVVVVTSRDALAGLVARDGAARVDLGPLPLDQAVDLLRELIGKRAVADPDAAARLATRCCQLPLALRVAAERAVSRPAVPLADLAGELASQQQRLDLLDAGGDAHSAVREVFSWSFRYLDDAASRVFRLVSLHPGPDFDEFAAAAMTGMTPEQTGQLLDRLARAHLIQHAGPGRYSMHDLLRGYARERAAGDDAEGERQAGLTRLFDHYLHAAAGAMDTLHPAEHDRRPAIPQPAPPSPPVSNPMAARTWLDAELANLVAVAVHTSQHGWPHHATRLSATLFRYLDVSGHFAEAITIHTSARSAARDTGDRAGEARALSGLGTVDARQCRHSRAANHFRQALALYVTTSDRAGEARVLNNLGIIDERQGRYTSASGHLQQALALCRTTSDRAGEARVLNNLGIIDERQGRYTSASGHLQQALALYRATGDRAGEARALSNLGIVDGRQGRYSQATDHLQLSLALCRTTGDRVGEAGALTNLGDVELRRGRHQQATSHLKQALALYRATGYPGGEAEALNSLGELLLATGRPADARTQHDAALGLASQTGDQYQQARAHHGLGRAQHALGHPSRARRHWQQALTRYADIGAPEADQIGALLAADDPPVRNR